MKKQGEKRLSHKNDVPPCQVDSEKTKTFYQEFHRRHAFESLLVTLVVVKIEITLDCRNQIVTRSKLSEIVHFGFENCCSIVRSKRANTVRPYRDNSTFAIGLRDVEDAVHYDMRRKITLALAILYTREPLKCEISAFEGAKLRRRLKKTIPVCY
jgi:hypothetical protein